MGFGGCGAVGSMVIITGPLLPGQAHKAAASSVILPVSQCVATARRMAWPWGRRQASGAAVLFFFFFFFFFGPVGWQVYSSPGEGCFFLKVAQRFRAASMPIGRNSGPCGSRPAGRGLGGKRRMTRWPATVFSLRLAVRPARSL